MEHSKNFGGYTVKGHAAVFNRKSLDLGSFTERVTPGDFHKVNLLEIGAGHGMSFAFDLDDVPGSDGREPTS